MDRKPFAVPNEKPPKPASLLPAPQSENVKSSEPKNLEVQIHVTPSTTSVSNDGFMDRKLLYTASVRLDDGPSTKKTAAGVPQATKKIPIEHYKKVHFGCEICGQPPKLMCSACTETYYCTEKHCTLDFHAIHKFVCIKIMIIRNPEIKNDQWKRYTKHEVEENIHMRKQIVLTMANNIAQRHMLRGNYAFAIPCSLLAQKLVNEMHGLHCMDMVRPYMIISEAYMARGKIEKTKFYSGLINHITKNKLDHKLPRSLELEFQRLTARILVETGNLDGAVNILANQVAELSMETGLDTHELLDGIFYLGYCCFVSRNLIAANTFYSYFLEILTRILVKELASGALYLHQCIEEDLNSQIKHDAKLGLQPRNEHKSWACALSEKDYAVYLRRERFLTYLRTIWKQFEAAVRHDYPDLFPRLHYCVAMILFICKQWSEACGYYNEGCQLTEKVREDEFRAIRRILGMLEKHVRYCGEKEQPGMVPNVDVEEKAASPAVPPATAAQEDDQIEELRSHWDDDELGETLQTIVGKIQKYQQEIKKDEDSLSTDYKATLRRIGVI